MTFLKEFLKNPFSIGAVVPSSKALCNQMVGSIDFDDCKCIVEYGPGTGVFTGEIIKNKPDDTLFLAIEKNSLFCERLRHQYGSIKNVLIINDDAENINHYLAAYDLKSVDYIVSGLPFTILPDSTTEQILNVTQNIMDSTSRFILFQYSPCLKRTLCCKFSIKSEKLVLKNFPPAFVYEIQRKGVI